MAKRSAAVEHPVEPDPPEPSQSELDARMTTTSIDFLHRIFSRGPRRWLELVAGEDHSGQHASRDAVIANFHEPTQEWSTLGHLRPRESPQSLREWVALKRVTTTVSFTPALLSSPQDCAPLLPMTVLYARHRIVPLPHRGSAGAFSMADRTRLAARMKALAGLPLAPSFYINSWDSLTSFWALDQAILVDAAYPLLLKLARLTGGESCSPHTPLALPGQFTHALLPRREITVEEGSGASYTLQEVKGWLGEGTAAPRSMEEQLRDMAVRVHRA